MDTPPAWQLQPPSSAPRLWLLLLLVVLPVAITVGALVYAASESSPERLVGRSPLASDLAIVAGVTVLCLAIHWFIARAMRRHAATLDRDGLSIATGFHARTLGWRELLPARARVVDLDEHTAFKPVLKTNGISLPGFQSGWFRLRNLRRAFVATAGGSRVVHLPTTLGYDLLLQPRQPQAFLARLQELAPAVAQG